MYNVTLGMLQPEPLGLLKHIETMDSVYKLIYSISNYYYYSTYALSAEAVDAKRNVFRSPFTVSSQTI